MTPIELDAQANAWVTHRLAPAGSPEYNASAWAIDTYDFLYEDPETLWLLILAVHRKNQSLRVQQLLSAGMVEDLLGMYGDQFIELIEIEARIDPSLLKIARWCMASSDERSTMGATSGRMGSQRMGRGTGVNVGIHGHLVATHGLFRTVPKRQLFGDFDTIFVLPSTGGHGGNLKRRQFVTCRTVRSINDAVLTAVSEPI